MYVARAHTQSLTHKQTLGSNENLLIQCIGCEIMQQEVTATVDDDVIQVRKDYVPGTSSDLFQTVIV
jgi:hypothetical protein